jgi:hypothetical protein
MTIMTGGTGAAYEHGTWEDNMVAAIEVFAAIWKNLTEMKASLESDQVQGPPKQINLVGNAINTAAQLGWQGAQILASTNDRYKGLLDTYAHLGGQVAGVKEHHTMAGA